ncbi:MAG: hypothetical protein LBU42_10115 [Prevotellaceae bacterium]|jgi:predicted RNase H-like nuclease (RuvC/YqgF family)|nr:hypothetical protein [Prevotellaceae bacterium]
MTVAEMEIEIRNNEKEIASLTLRRDNLKIIVAALEAQATALESKLSQLIRDE